MSRARSVPSPLCLWRDNNSTASELAEHAIFPAPAVSGRAIHDDSELFLSRPMRSCGCYSLRPPRANVDVPSLLGIWRLDAQLCLIDALVSPQIA